MLVDKNKSVSLRWELNSIFMEIMQNKKRIALALFLRAIFQVAERVTVGNLVRTVACATRLKLSKSADYNRILIVLLVLQRKRSKLASDFSSFVCLHKRMQIYARNFSFTGLIA